MLISGADVYAGSKASVVPPQTPGDDMPMPLTTGPGIITSEYAVVPHSNADTHDIPIRNQLFSATGECVQASKEM